MKSIRKLELKISGSRLVNANINCPARIAVNQGGSRSGKTYSILQVLIAISLSRSGLVVSIVRKTLPALRRTALRDFIEIMEGLNIWDPSKFNKTELTYELNGNLIEFFSLDQPQKVRGAKRDILFINECNELKIEDWRQLLLRTAGRIFMDFNPSDIDHWVYDVAEQSDAELIKSTYLDNPFLEPTIIQSIESFRDKDANFWRVYGLGERGQPQSLVFTQQPEQVDEPFGKLIARGMDFGFSTDPTTLIEVYRDGDRLCLNELLWSTGLTNSDIIECLKSMEIPRSDRIVADSSEPKSIEEIRRGGFNIFPAYKPKDGIVTGLKMLKSNKIFITSWSLNLIKEFRNYKYIEDMNGNPTAAILDAHNHGIDAARYVLLKFGSTGRTIVM